jgi:hypothetical protein
LLDEELDAFQFVLAENLGMTLGQLDEMPNAEYIAWRAFDAYRRAMIERERNKNG